MSRAKRQLERRRRSMETIDRLMRQPALVNIVHYSCERLRRDDGTSPRITSIAIHNVESGQSTSFSVHQIAERQGLDSGGILANYNDLERTMLREFYNLVLQQSAYEWVHWNMRDSNFGFAALEHRFKVLGGQPVEIPMSKRIDLSNLLGDLYGPNYVPHGDRGRLDSLLTLNNITRLDFLPGAEEAAAFERGEYVRLHQSTLRKVHAIAAILEKIWDGTMKSNATWRETYGTTIGGVVEAMTDTWWYKALGFVGIVASIVALTIAVF